MLNEIQKVARREATVGAYMWTEWMTEGNLGQSGTRESREKIESFQEVGGNAGKVAVSPRNEGIEKANIFLGALVFL